MNVNYTLKISKSSWILMNNIKYLRINCHGIDKIKY